MNGPCPRLLLKQEAGPKTTATWKNENSNFTGLLIHNLDELTRNLILRRTVHGGIPPFWPVSSVRLIRWWLIWRFLFESKYSEWWPNSTMSFLKDLYEFTESNSYAHKLIYSCLNRWTGSLSLLPICFNTQPSAQTYFWSVSEKRKTNRRTPLKRLFGECAVPRWMPQTEICTHWKYTWQELWLRGASKV